MKRTFLICGLLVALAASAFFAWRSIQARKGGAISASGGRAMNVTLPELGRTFLQGDPLWRNELLGKTQQSLGSVGCTVCSVAMASTSLGYAITPPDLNAKLRDAQGFTDEGWLIWGALPKATNDQIEVVVAARPAHAELDAALLRGEFPVVKFILLSGVTHWVTIVGKEGFEYLVRDPMMRSEKPVTLASRTSAIYSVRYIRRKAGA